MLYIGPETIIPLASVLAAIGGFFLMLGHRVVGFARSTYSFFTRTVSGLFGRR